MPNPDVLRTHTRNILNGPGLYDHQREAARKIHEALTGDVRAVVAAAEMQAGKSGVALALSCLQRLSMDDSTICDASKVYDTLYMITMVETALLEQAGKDLSDAPNVVVSNFNRFRHHLDNEFHGGPPSLIIIDESHYGSGAASVRYSDVFDYLEKENPDCKVVFISANSIWCTLCRRVRVRRRNTSTTNDKRAERKHN